MFYTVFMSRSSRQWRAEMIAGGGSVVRGWYEDQHWSHHPALYTRPSCIYYFPRTALLNLHSYSCCCLHIKLCDFLFDQYCALHLHFKLWVINNNNNKYYFIISDYKVENDNQGRVLPSWVDQHSVGGAWEISKLDACWNWCLWSGLIQFIISIFSSSFLLSVPVLHSVTSKTVLHDIHNYIEDESSKLWYLQSTYSVFWTNLSYASGQFSKCYLSIILKVIIQYLIKSSCILSYHFFKFRVWTIFWTWTIFIEGLFCYRHWETVSRWKSCEGGNQEASQTLPITDPRQENLQRTQNVETHETRKCELGEIFWNRLMKLFSR